MQHGLQSHYYELNDTYRHSVRSLSSVPKEALTTRKVSVLDSLNNTSTDLTSQFYSLDLLPVQLMTATFSGYILFPSAGYYTFRSSFESEMDCVRPYSLSHVALQRLQALRQQRPHSRLLVDRALALCPAGVAAVLLRPLTRLRRRVSPLPLALSQESRAPSGVAPAVHQRVFRHPLRRALLLAGTRLRLPGCGDHRATQQVLHDRAAGRRQTHPGTQGFQ